MKIHYIVRHPTKEGWTYKRQGDAPSRVRARKAFPDAIEVMKHLRNGCDNGNVVPASHIVWPFGPC